jgi:hypothetical protein
MEDAEFLKPRVAHSGETNGVAIGEFPLYSYVLSLPCHVRGSWSEYDPKFFILILWILNLIVWLRWAKDYLGEVKLDTPSLGIFFGFSTFSLLFMTISIPDNLSLLLVGIAALLTQRKKKAVFSWALFALAFAIRPYFIPLAILVNREKRWLAATSVAAVLIYVVWYKWWALNSEINYYYIQIPSLVETLSTLKVVELIGVIAREWFHFLLLPLVIWKWKKLNKLEILGLGFSVILVVVLRGNHLIIHSYYFWAAFVFAFLCMARATADLPEKWKTAVVIFYALTGIAQTQHQFHAQAQARSRQIADLANKAGLKPEDKVAVYVGDGSCSTNYLYWMKHHGWCFYETQFQGADHCPSGAKYYLKYEADEPTLKPCIFAPTEKPNDR